MSTLQRSILALAATLLATASAGAYGQSYRFQALGTLGGTLNYASAISNSGQVVGWSSTLGDADRQATLWDGNSVIALGAPGTPSDARGINDFGRIVGNTSAGLTWWDAASPSSAVTVSSGCRAGAINNLGQIAASCVVPGEIPKIVVRWDRNSATSLGSPGINVSVSAMNDTGKIVVTTSIGASAAGYWDGTKWATLLNLPGQGPPNAQGINDAGQVVGSSYVDGLHPHATLWNGSTPTDLGGVPGYTSSWAADINNLGQVVGSSKGVATLWNGMVAFDLNTFLDAATRDAGWMLTYATGINEQGWIIGNAINVVTNASSAFLLTPVPEPETYALMLVGLIFVVRVARRRGSMASIC